MDVDAKIAALEAELAPLRAAKATEAQRKAEEGRAMAATISARIMTDIAALKDICKDKSITHSFVIVPKPDKWTEDVKLVVTPYAITVDDPNNTGWDSSSSNC